MKCLWLYLGSLIHLANAILAFQICFPFLKKKEEEKSTETFLSEVCLCLSSEGLGAQTESRWNNASILHLQRSEKKLAPLNFKGVNKVT